ncbi:hypothetical protein [Kineosporia babensis]|uniref:Uncharacterized protein n=1 Tax=Kineosporia babensis TaxID=499548 RepID=A0A9X1NC14_9ACTN|nr:hypothetical protein [Kineosporia babensis]MCD5311330.1 hypothetical protein [Kineosporia babensis]
MLQFVGLLLVIPGLIAWYRNTMKEAEERRAAGLSPEAPPALIQRAELERALEQEPSPAELTDLRLQAQALRKNHSVQLFFAAGLIIQVGAMIADPGLGRAAFAVLAALIIGPAVLRVERNVRVAKAFLLRYPPEASQSMPTR